MTFPEYKGESKAQQDFIVPFDGSQHEISEAEQQQAAKLLNTAVEHKLIENADHTQGTMFTALFLGIKYEDGSSLAINILTSSIMKNEGGYKYSVLISGNDIDNQIRDTYVYEIATDVLSVLRQDLGDMALQKANNQPGSIRVTGADPLESDPNFDDIQNTRLEDQLGMNNQPVGIDEIQKLVAILDSAAPRSS